MGWRHAGSEETLDWCKLRFGNDNLVRTIVPKPRNTQACFLASTGLACLGSRLFRELSKGLMISLLSFVQEVTLPKAPHVQQGGQVKLPVINEWPIGLVSMRIDSGNVVFRPCAFILDSWCGFIRGIKTEGQGTETLRFK